MCKEKNCLCRGARYPFYGLLNDLFGYNYSFSRVIDDLLDFETSLTDDISNNVPFSKWSLTKDGTHYWFTIKSTEPEIAVDDEKKTVTYRYVDGNSTIKETLTIPSDAIINTLKAEKVNDEVHVVVEKAKKVVKPLEGRKIEIQ